MPKIILILYLLVNNPIFAQNVSIEGRAPAYIGKTIEAYRIEDYLSMRNVLVASAKVKSDSTFRLLFDSNSIQKIILKSNNNKSFLYIEPGNNYTIFFPNRSKYAPYIPSGYEVELSFYELDSTDINYKILSFQRWIDNFIGRTYHLRNTVESTEYIESFEKFKANVQKAYQNDTSYNATFLKTHIKFSIAGLENINSIAERNRYEKHDFFIKFHPVEYNNDAYMEYISSFYDKLPLQLSQETNNAFYKGVLKSSPSEIMNALGQEYTLVNRRIREIVMIKALSECYFSNDYPQTNIITILDSLKEQSLFKENTVIAENMRYRLLNLIPGSKAPNFALISDGLKTQTLIGLKGKHIYLHFFDPTKANQLRELDLVEDLSKRYDKYVRIISICRKNEVLDLKIQQKIEECTHQVYQISDSNPIWKNYQTRILPHYSFIDAAGYIIKNPALSPTPNGEYKTIDRTFFELKKVIEQRKKEEIFNPRG